MSDEQVADAPILILGNKIDVPGACSEDELRTILSLHGRTTGKVWVQWSARVVCCMFISVCFHFWVGEKVVKLYVFCCVSVVG